MPQVILKTKTRIATGEAVIYSGNFAILQTKEVVDGKLIINQEPFPLDQIIGVANVREAEVRAAPELLVEQDDCGCNCGC